MQLARASRMQAKHSGNPVRVEVLDLVPARHHDSSVSMDLKPPLLDREPDFALRMHRVSGNFRASTKSKERIENREFRGFPSEHLGSSILSFQGQRIHVVPAPL
jgi:hypothetical protein